MLTLQKTKFEQKCGLLAKQQTVLSNNVIALKKQSDKQFEQIKKLDERDKLLSQQMV